MNFKQGVDPKYLSAPAWWGLWKADEVHKGLAQKEAVCTSTGDSRHSADRSRHYTGDYGFGFCDAFDLRTWHVEAEEYAAVLREELGPDYVVIVESDHIHCHWAPVYRDPPCA